MEDKLEQLRIAAESGDMNAMCEYGKALAKRGSYNDVLSWLNSRKLVDAATFCYYLGICYLNGDGVEKDEKEAFQWFYMAAEQGYANAQYNVGICYLNGDGVEKDEKQAFQWFFKAAEQGIAEAQYNVGIRYLVSDGVEKNEKKAYQWFLKAAEQGYAQAQYNVGTCYFYGDGVEKDEKQAFQWFFKAAEQGIAEALYNLGVCFISGSGVEKNEKKAYQCFYNAAEQGIAKAQHNLGVCFSRGSGVEKDEKEAFQWFFNAARQGIAEAQYNVGRCYFYGSSVEKNEKEAFQWFYMAAKQGIVEAQYNVGRCYFYGDGVEKDKKQAFQCFLKAADQGYAEAQFVVGGCYLKGVGVKKDEEKAYHYIFSAADNGSFEAQCLLGFKFNKFIEIDKNNTNALENIKQQADANNDVAQFTLAEMEFWGNDVVKRDRYNAAYWYEKIKGSDSYSEQAKRRLAFINYFGLGVPKNVEKAKELWQEIGYSWERDPRPVSLKELLICYVESVGRNTFEEPECKLWDKFYIPLKRLNYSRYSDVSFEKFWIFCNKYHNIEPFPSISIDAFWNMLKNYEDARQILQYSKKPEKLLQAVKEGKRDVFEEQCEEEDRVYLGRVNVFFSIREAYNLKNLEPWSIHTHNKDILTIDVLSYMFDSDAIKSATNIITKKNECNFSNDLDFAERTIRRDVASCIEAVDDVSGYYNYETRHNMNDILESSEFSEVTNYVKRLLDKKEENSTESNKDNEDYTTIIALLHTLLLNKKKEDFDIFSKDIYDIPPLDNQNLNTSKQSEDELKELGGILFRKNYLPKFRKIAEDIKDLSTAYAFMYMLTMSKCFILEKLLTETYKPIVDSINELLEKLRNREISQKLILKIEKYDEIIKKYKCKETPKDPWKYIQHFAIELFDLMFQSNLVMTKDMVTSKSTVERQMFKKFVLENDLTGKFISEYDVQCDIKACLKYWGSGKAQLSESSRKKINELTARYK